MLTGQAKKDYQREYMRKRRAKGLIKIDPAKELDPVLKAIRGSRSNKVDTKGLTEPQSLNLEPPTQEKSKLDIIKSLKEQINTITPKENMVDLCLQCLRLGKSNLSVGWYDITTDTGERKVPLCSKCRDRLLIYC